MVLFVSSGENPRGPCPPLLDTSHPRPEWRGIATDQVRKGCALGNVEQALNAINE